MIFFSKNELIFVDVCQSIQIEGEVLQAEYNLENQGNEAIFDENVFTCIEDTTTVKPQPGDTTVDPVSSIPTVKPITDSTTIKLTTYAPITNSAPEPSAITTISYQQLQPSKKLSTGSIIAIAISVPSGVLFLLVVLGGFFYYSKLKKNKVAVADSNELGDMSSEKRQSKRSEP